MVALREEHPGWAGHLVLLHDSERHRLETLSTWAGDAFEAGDKVVYIEPADGPAIARALTGTGLEVDEARADGQLEILPPQVFYQPGAVGQLVDRALAEGFGAVRISGESRHALSVLAWDEHQSVERRMSRLAERLPLHFLCQYDLDVLDDERLVQATAAHLRGVRREGFSTHDAGDGLLRLSGDLDRQNARTLAAVIAAALRPAGPPIVSQASALPGPAVLALDLEGVTFLDVAGCRAIVEATEPLRREGGRVLLVAPRTQVDRVLRLMDVDIVPGLDIVGDE